MLCYSAVLGCYSFCGGTALGLRGYSCSVKDVVRKCSGNFMAVENCSGDAVTLECVSETCS